MNLLESLQKTQTQRAQQPIPGQAADLRTLLASKSGKAGTTSGPAISNIQEQQALVDFNTQATTQQQAAQVGVGSQQLAQKAQQQQFSQGQQQLTQKRQEVEQTFNQEAEKINNNLQRLENDLESKEGQQALQEALFTKRLANKQYVAELERAGIERRLNDANAFKLEAAKTAFDNWNEIFANETEFAKAMELDKHEFDKELLKMDMSMAESIIKSNNEAANRQTLWSSAGSIGTAAIQAGVQANEAGFFKDKPLEGTTISTSGAGSGLQDPTMMGDLA